MRRTATLALAVRLAIMKNVPHNEFAKLLADLQESHLLNRDVGRQDYEAYSLYLGPAYLGKQDFGMWGDEITSKLRKERSEPSRILREPHKLSNAN